MARDDAVYVGLRGSSSPARYGGRTVVGVREGSSNRTLQRPPCDSTMPDQFEWGYEGPGPRVLAEAILADRLGLIPDSPITAAFVREVVAHLPSEFELRGHQIDAWVAPRILAACRR